MRNPLQKQTSWEKWLSRLSPDARRQQEYLSRRANRETQPAWYVLYVSDTEPQPQFVRIGSFEDTRRFLIAQRIKSPDTFAVPVFGLPAFFSRVQGPTDRRYLIHPNGKVVPLFDAMEEIVIDSSYMLGDHDLDLTPVTTASLTGPAPRNLRGRPVMLEEDDIDEEEDPELDADIPML